MSCRLLIVSNTVIEISYSKCVIVLLFVISSLSRNLFLIFYLDARISPLRSPALASVEMTAGERGGTGEMITGNYASKTAVMSRDV